MTAEQFRNFWNQNYSESYPIGHELKLTYEARWFRIHSLPESKRYAENEDEYQIILERQNKLISDIFGEFKDFTILIGLYTDEINDEHKDEQELLHEYNKADTLNLHKIRPDEYEFEMYYDIFIKNAKWTNGTHNDILKKIADDEIRAIFINPNADCIICPYDGGMDIILNDTNTRDRFKTKYKDWLSDREDGL